MQLQKIIFITLNQVPKRALSGVLPLPGHHQVVWDKNRLHKQPVPGGRGDLLHLPGWLSRCWSRWTRSHLCHLGSNQFPVLCSTQYRSGEQCECSVIYLHTCTVEPLSNGHVWDWPFVLYREVKVVIVSITERFFLFCPYLESFLLEVHVVLL